MISVNGLAFNPGTNPGAYYNNNVSTKTLAFGDANGHTFTVTWSAPSNRKFFWDARKQVCGSTLAYNSGGTSTGVWNTCVGASGWTIGSAAINGFGLDDLTDIRSLPDSGGPVPIPPNAWTLTPLDTAAYYHIELDETKSLIENGGTDMWGNQQLGLGQVKRVCFGAGTTNTVASAAAQAAGFSSMLDRKLVRCNRLNPLLQLLWHRGRRRSESYSISARMKPACGRQRASLPCQFPCQDRSSACTGTRPRPFSSN